ncbi:hypothetical protein BU14_0075s0051 [Porphyra umbilicalis]|uniref:Uncharacterized protein n=1 Tax=Porphyra umbilicalis TaxID=2786 RepID=A0A1X6PFE2_PORUM|nr:hypothetical protein BU14_0075s0051 [Porphyra umbilicalis]|eukprot:OSX79561.1 hypothetical protein BU14_0075s0051 [Porphyra umbilicalis]
MPSKLASKVCPSLHACTCPRAPTTTDTTAWQTRLCVSSHPRQTDLLECRARARGAPSRRQSPRHAPHADRAAQHPLCSCSAARPTLKVDARAAGPRRPTRRHPRRPTRATRPAAPGQARPAAVATRPAAPGHAGRWVALHVVPAAATATATITAAAAATATATITAAAAATAAASAAATAADATPTAAAIGGRMAPRRHASVAAGTPPSPTPRRARPPSIPLRRRLVVGRRWVALAHRRRRRPAAVVVRPLVLVCRPPPRLVVLLRLRLRLPLLVRLHLPLPLPVRLRLRLPLPVRLLVEVRGPLPPVVGPIVAPTPPPAGWPPCTLGAWERGSMSPLPLPPPPPPSPIMGGGALVGSACC